MIKAMIIIVINTSSTSRYLPFHKCKFIYKRQQKLIKKLARCARGNTKDLNRIYQSSKIFPPFFEHFPSFLLTDYAYAAGGKPSPRKHEKIFFEIS